MQNGCKPRYFRSIRDLYHSVADHNPVYFESSLEYFRYAVFLECVIFYMHNGVVLFGIELCSFSLYLRYAESAEDVLAAGKSSLFLFICLVDVGLFTARSILS